MAAKASLERSMVLVHPSLLAQLSTIFTVTLAPVQGLPPPPPAAAAQEILAFLACSNVVPGSWCTLACHGEGGSNRDGMTAHGARRGSTGDQPCTGGSAATASHVVEVEQRADQACLHELCSRDGGQLRDAL